jgi:hypothetical protein
MRKYSPLRPSLVGSLVDDAVRHALDRGCMLNIREEASRISAKTGVSGRAIARELIVAGITARANIEFPKLDATDPYTKFLEERRRLRIVWRNPEPAMGQANSRRT